MPGPRDGIKGFAVQWEQSLSHARWKRSRALPCDFMLTGNNTLPYILKFMREDTPHYMLFITIIKKKKVHTVDG